MRMGRGRQGVGHPTGAGQLVHVFWRTIACPSNVHLVHGCKVVHPI